MLKRLEELKATALEEIESISKLEELEAWRIRHLGKKSALTQVLRGLAELSVEERQSVGRLANEVKAALEQGLKGKRASLKKSSFAAIAEQRAFDVTLPGRVPSLGRLHPITQTLRQICEVFATMGFQVVESPEVEWDYYNFEALNIPKDHPARDMFATLWVDSPTVGVGNNMLLRTHTTHMDIRVMEAMRPPVRVITPGKVYRYEATDATHEFMFYQVDGLAVDKNITLADLKGTLFELARRLFGSDRKVRFRCDYFPFVEPGVEMAIDCLACGGKGCRLCGNTGWIEILGAGMVHPDVLKRVTMTPRSILASPLAWVWSEYPCSNTALTISVFSTGTT